LLNVGECFDTNFRFKHPPCANCFEYCQLLMQRSGTEVSQI
jgi:hypothetical protein